MHSKLKKLHRYLISNGFSNEASFLIKIADDVEGCPDYSTCLGSLPTNTSEMTLRTTLEIEGVLSTFIEWEIEAGSLDSDNAWVPAVHEPVDNSGLEPDDILEETAGIGIEGWITLSVQNILGILNNILDPAE